MKKIKIINLLLLTIAGVVNAFGVVLFLMPANLYDGGISGTSMLLANITNLPLAIFLLILNIPLFIYGYRKEGRLFTTYSLFAVLIYSIASYIFEPLISDGVSPIVLNDIFLSSVFGGLISGIGSGLTIRFGGAIDGIEVLSIIFAKKLNLTVGTFIMIYNCFIYIIAGVVSNNFILPLYSIVAYIIGLFVIDFIVEGLDKAKSAMIITSKPKEVSKALSDEFGHGVTNINAKGYYEAKEQIIVYFVVNRFQIAKMKDIITEIDENAFVTISEVSEFMGSHIDKK